MPNKSILLIDLDSILDTRLGTLVTINENLLETIIQSGYHTREYDVFEGISEEEFNKTYELRDKEVLHNSIVTPLIYMLEEFAVKTIKETANTPYELEPEIHINTYPYDLNADEESVILEVVNSYIKGKSVIKIVNKSYEDITPKYLKDEISIYVTYRYDNWLETHSANDNLKLITCPETTLLGPAVKFKKEEGSDKVKFSDIELLVSLAINLKLIHVENFSCILGKTSV